MVCELPQQRAYTHNRDHVGCSGPPLPAQQHALLVTHVHRISHPRRFFFFVFFFDRNHIYVHRCFLTPQHTEGLSRTTI